MGAFDGQIQGTPPGPPLERDQDVLNAVRHLVECERKFLREVHQNEQAGRSLNVRCARVEFGQKGEVPASSVGLVQMHMP